MTTSTTTSAMDPGGPGRTTGWRATRLRCQRLAEPLGIDRPRPTFAWTPAGHGDGEPSAHQILVAGDPAPLAGGAGDMWDSGRVASTEVTGVRYAGAPLAAGRRYWWTVRLWGRDGRPGPYAPPTTFETGPLGPGDWLGTWIGGGAGVSSPLLRTQFAIPAGVRRARAHVAALGYYELRVNGARVGDRVLDPATTSYVHDPDLRDAAGQPARIPRASVLYSTYDVTDRLVAGENAVGLMLGHGWYSAEPENGPGPMPRTPYGDRPAALLQLEIETEDGEHLTVTSHEGWRTAPGPVRYNDYAHGERYDARRESPGWDAPGHQAEGWTPVTAISPPDTVPRSQPGQPIRVIETLRPVATRTTEDGRRLVDFGQHFSGWTRIRVSGPAGAEVTLRHAGEVTADGELDDDANMGAWLTARQTDTYVLRGEGEELWEPRFTLHGFRHLEVTTSDPAVRVRELAGRVVHSDLARVGEFGCSDDLLNRIHRNVLWSFRASFQGFPQDAADRGERVGWVGDPGWSVEDYLYDFDASAFWLKWLDDLADTQLPDGRFPTICPIHWRGMVDPDDWEVPDDQEIPPLPTWPYTDLTDFAMTSFASIVWNLYRFHGDRAILEDHYPAMRRGLEHLRSRADGLILREGLGDHMEPQPDGTCSVSPKRTPVALTSTAWFHAVTTMVADAAETIGRGVDAREYRALAAAIRTAFNDAFLDPRTGRYATGSQTAQAMALWHGLVPDEHRERVVEALVDRITEQDDGHLETGTMGTAALQHVLPEVGAADVMYRIATRTTFPSWGHQVVNGASTVWETWGGDRTFSRNMKLLALISTFLYNDVAGLAPAAPGWRVVRMRPRLTEQLTHAHARVRTVRGDAAVDWRTEYDALVLTAQVPAASTAEIWLPTDRFGDDDARLALTVDGVPLPPGGHAPGVRRVTRRRGHLVVETTGGTHRLRLCAASRDEPRCG
ncbi:family 78 glycoside hydrolase catalytic domain [Streptomyces mayteni]